MIRVILTASIISIKFNEDDYYDNSFYAKVGGISLQEVNELEYAFLSMCGFTMSINENKYLKYKVYLKDFTA